MPPFYVDTSAVVKRYHPEPGTAVVDELLSLSTAADRVFTSFLTVLEVTSAMHRLAGSGQIEVALVREALVQFRRDVNTSFFIWPLTGEVVASAVPVVERYRLRSADAIHLATALAIARARSNQRFALVASDRELLAAAHTASLLTLNPAEGDAPERLRSLRRSTP